MERKRNFQYKVVFDSTKILILKQFTTHLSLHPVHLRCV